MSSGADWWGAPPPSLARLWQPQPPLAREADDQFADASDSEDEAAPGGGCSLQTVVAAPAGVPRLALGDMVATPQPLAGGDAPAGGGPCWWNAAREPAGTAERPAGEVDGELPPPPLPPAGAGDPTELSDRLAWLRLAGGRAAAAEASPRSVPDTASPRSVPDTASVSLRSLLDTTDLTGDATDSETAEQLLGPAADTPRTVRGGAASPPGSDRDAAVTPRAEDGAVTWPGASGRKVALTVRGDAGPGEGSVRRSVVAVGTVAILKESCRGGTVTSLVVDAAAVALAGGRDGTGTSRRDPDREGAGVSMDGSSGGGAVTSLADSGRGETPPSAADSGRGGTVASLADSPTEPTTSLPGAVTASRQEWAPRPQQASSDGAADWPAAAGALFAEFGPAAPPPACPVHGASERPPAAKRSPARRLSFTLDNPSPLLVEYYLKHPEERLQVLEDAAATITEPAGLPHTNGPTALESAPDAVRPPAPDALRPATPETRLPPSEGSAAAAERPRRRWGDERASAAELRAALSVRRSSDDTGGGSPRREEREASPRRGETAASPRREGAASPGMEDGAGCAPREERRRDWPAAEVPLGWRSVLHGLPGRTGTSPATAPEPEQAPLPPPGAARPARWRRSEPLPPPVTLEQSPRPSGSPSGRRRRPRFSPRPRRTPPALWPLAARSPVPRRPTPNFDSHAIQEIVLGRAPAGAALGWGTPSPPAAHRPRSSSGSPAGRPPLTPPPPGSPDPPSAVHGETTEALEELRELLALHEQQMAALVEQQRRQRRALEASFRRVEDALLLRLRRQLSAAERLAARPADPAPPPPPPAPRLGRRPGERAQLDPEEADRSPPPPSSAAQQAVSPSAYDRYDSHASTSPARERRPAWTGPPFDAVPTPVARRLASPPPPALHRVTVPPEALRPDMRASYAKLTAAARGYLTRRLMRTEKVQSIIAAAKESMACALRLQREVDLTKQVTRQDVELHERLVNQVRGACYSLHQLFIASTPSQRLAVIAADRAARAHAAERRRSGDPAGHLSRATLLAIERKRQREWTDAAGGRPAPASPRSRPRAALGSPRARPRASPAGRPRRVVAHSPRTGSRTSLLSDRSAGSGGRGAKSARSLVQLATIYAPNPVRRAKSSQSQLGGAQLSQSLAGEPKRRQRTARAWR